MDLLFELLLGLFFEMPLEMAMESKRLKPWVKTALMFVVINLITILVIIITVSMSHREGPAGDVAIGIAIAALFFGLSIYVCVTGHRRGWRRERSCPLEPAAAPAHHTPDPDVTIRTASLSDLDAIAAVEAECFPAAEAATKEEFSERLKHYADHFWLMFDGDRLISFVDGFVTDEPDLTDKMYADASMHNAAGAWQMIFGVNTIHACRNRGCAARLIEQAILDAKEQGRKGVVLTCKPEKVAYYLKFGFVNEGISPNSTHGGAVWHQMRLTF